MEMSTFVNISIHQYLVRYLIISELPCFFITEANYIFPLFFTNNEPIMKDEIKNINYEPATINSVKEFMDWVKENTIDNTYVYLYRGHENEKWTLLPTVYREGNGKGYRPKEFSLYQEMYRQNPEMFSDCPNLFSRLVKMQHYGLPTRLLDITKNPLVGLFFACENTRSENENEYGKVILFKINNSKILYPASISEASLVDLDFPVLWKELFIEIIIALDKFYASEAEIVKESPDDPYIASCKKIIWDTIADGYDLYISLKKLNKLALEYSDRHPGKKYFFGFYDRFGKFQGEICMAVCNFLKIKDTRHLSFTYFKEGQNSELEKLLLSLINTSFILPPKNNDRIRRQDGAFILFSPFNTKNRYQFEKFINCRIPPNRKQEIIRELNNYGINRGYLFPDPAEQADDIKKNIYPPETLILPGTAIDELCTIELNINIKQV